MKAIEFIYQDTQIHFALSNDKNVMVNATEMAKAFNKKTELFLKSDHAKAFIEVLKLQPNGGSLNSVFTPNGGNKEFLREEDIIEFRGRNGIYFHRILALKFAAWLDPAFEVWVYSAIEHILFGDYKKHDQAVIDNLQFEKELEVVESELYNNPLFVKYQNINLLIKTTNAEKRGAIKARINQIKFDFSEKK